MAPAQVPHIGFVFMNSRKGSRRPASLASKAIVVDSGRNRESAKNTNEDNGHNPNEKKNRTPSRNNECIALLKVLLSAHKNNHNLVLHIHLLEHDLVFREGPLER